jgi:hypothetical protein
MKKVFGGSGFFSDPSSYFIAQALDPANKILTKESDLDIQTIQFHGGGILWRTAQRWKSC